MKPLLPRLATSTIEREHISAWLRRHAHMPLRFLLAAAGSGKTSALVTYARSCGETTHYIHLKHRSDADLLQTCLLEAFELDSFSYGALLAKLSVFESLELIIDGIERLDETEHALLERLAQELPTNCSLILAGTATSIALHNLEATGLAAVVPRRAFLFSQAEIEAVGNLLGIFDQHEAFAQVLESSDGWAIVAADMLRCAAETTAPLADVYDNWVTQRSRSFTAYMQEEITRLPLAIRALFDSMLNGETLGEAGASDLEHSGAFVILDTGIIRPYKVVRDLLSSRISTVTSKVDPITIRMFGRFSIRCGEREVAWIRRRDQQIFRYIAVRPSGRVKKSEIIEFFWPNTDSHSAAQSLRTACSNIRKALASVMAMATVEQLFVTDGQELYINFDKTVTDVRRFKLHVAEASTAESDERIEDALAHYRAAERLYRDDLFSSEPEEAWFLPQREVYRDMALLAEERITSLSFDMGEMENQISEAMLP